MSEIKWHVFYDDGGCHDCKLGSMRHLQFNDEEKMLKWIDKKYPGIYEEEINDSSDFFIMKGKRLNIKIIETKNIKSVEIYDE